MKNKTKNTKWKNVGNYRNESGIRETNREKYRYFLWMKEMNNFKRIHPAPYADRFAIMSVKTKDPQEGIDFLDFLMGDKNKTEFPFLSSSVVFIIGELNE